MGRIEYDESVTGTEIALQVGRERRTIRGKRGHAFLVRLEQALLDMSPRQLIVDQLCDEEGKVCALGLMARKALLDQGLTYAEANGILWDKAYCDPEEYAIEHLNISRTLAWLVMEANDDPEAALVRTPEQRWRYVHDQVCKMVRGEGVDRLP